MVHVHYNKSSIISNIMLKNSSIIYISLGFNAFMITLVPYSSYQPQASTCTIHNSKVLDHNILY